jgi:hypothetical protein
LLCGSKDDPYDWPQLRQFNIDHIHHLCFLKRAAGRGYDQLRKTPRHETHGRLVGFNLWGASSAGKTLHRPQSVRPLIRQHHFMSEINNTRCAQVELNELTSRLLRVSARFEPTTSAAAARVLRFARQPRSLPLAWHPLSPLRNQRDDGPLLHRVNDCLLFLSTCRPRFGLIPSCRYLLELPFASPPHYSVCRAQFEAFVWRFGPVRASQPALPPYRRQRCHRRRCHNALSCSLKRLFECTVF